VTAHCAAPCLTPGANASCRAERCLVRAAASGDPDARGKLFDRLYPTVLRQARALCRIPHDAEDLAQAALLNVVQQLHGIRDCRKLLAWMRVVVLNTHRMSARRSRFAPSAAACVPDLDSLAAPSADPVDRLGAERELTAVLRTIGSLSPCLRSTFRARVVDGKSTAEAARDLGITTAAVRTRLKRARQVLLAAVLESRRPTRPACGRS
jgi:RNA polymerase sigma factor (sigma-70 family)